MSDAVSHKDRCFEDSSYTQAALVKGSAGTNITQATVSSIDWTITETTGLVTPTSGTLSPSSVVFDTVQTTGWDGPLPGYNYRNTFTPANWPTPNLTYMIEVKFTMTDASVKHVVTELEVMALRRS